MNRMYDQGDSFKGNGRKTFEEALAHVKAGGRAQRFGWNGKDMWICLGEGRKIAADSFWNPHTKKFALTQPDAMAEVLPYLIMKTADNKILMGWLASQTDMLATDWLLLSDEAPEPGPQE